MLVLGSGTSNRSWFGDLESQASAPDPSVLVEGAHPGSSSVDIEGSHNGRIGTRQGSTFHVLSATTHMTTLEEWMSGRVPMALGNHSIGRDDLIESVSELVG
jgi:hypothetical protein